ncbi:MAG: Hsp20/alpha crystallin family protein [Candidatus Freyarchaeota archaeon]
MSEKINITPAMLISHDKEKYDIEIELPGVKKKDIEFEMTDGSFCLRAVKGNAEFSTCAVLAHPIVSSKAEARFRDGLLKVTVPLKEMYHGTKIKIK